MKRNSIGFFDRKGDWSIVERVFPHWAQAGTLCFVTWRVADSLPKAALARLDWEIAELLRGEGLDADRGWKQELTQRDSKTRARIQWKLFATRDRYLDQGRGECLLERPALSRIVEESLKTFDEERYFLTDMVIMPNHVHFIAAFEDEAALLKQNTDWKRFTARAINRSTGRGGEFWQVDQFDHLIRGPEQFEHYRGYIADNPKRAGLKPGQFRYYQKKL